MLTFGQTIVAGLTGYLSVYLLRALGHKNLAGIMKALSVVLVVVGLVAVIAEFVAAVKGSQIGEAVNWLLERVE